MVAAEKMKAELESRLHDVMFDYKGDHYVIVPENRRDWYVCCGEDIKHYTSVDPIMNEKIYHGKSLAEIADKLYNIEYA